MDWKMNNLHFESVNEIAQKYKAFPTSTLNSEHDFTCEDTLKTTQHMQKLKCEGYILGVTKDQIISSLFP